MLPLIKKGWLALPLLLLVACAQLGLQPAQTTDQKIAYAYGVHTAVLETASAEITAKQLTPREGNQILQLADQSRVLLDSAKDLANSDATTAQGKLILATGILTQLQTYLRTKQGKSP